MNEGDLTPPGCPAGETQRERIVVWCECGETPDGAIDRHCLSFPEHRDGERFEVVVAGWCDADVRVTNWRI